MYQSVSFYILLFIKCSVIQIDAARILAYYSTPFFSHQSTFYPVTNELLRRGHEVTVITPNPQYTDANKPEKLTEIDVNKVSYSIKEEYIPKFMKTMTEEQNVVEQYSLLSYMLTNIVEQQIMEPAVQNILKMNRTHFDLIIVEACVRAVIIVSHYFDAPVVEISSYGALVFNLETAGAPTHYFLYSPLSKRIHNLSLWEKIKEMYMHVGMHFTAHTMNDYVNQMFKIRLGPNVSAMGDLRKNISMLFVNMNPMWAGNLPAPPSLIYTGGHHFRPPQKLSNDLKKYLDDSRVGVIYISFGTNVDTSKITPKAIQKFVNVLSKLPYDVLWKWDTDDFPEKSTNIKISKWLPQAELLKHPKVVLFITQGGLQSTDEAILAGVPVIGVPMIVDQWFNVEKYLIYEIGKKIDITYFSEETLREAIISVIGNDSYRENMAKLRGIMYDQPQAPLERGIWWLEYVLRHGGAKHLRAPASGMTWIEYYEVELVCTALIFLLVMAYIIVRLIKYLKKQVIQLKSIVKVKMT